MLWRLAILVKACQVGRSLLSDQILARTLLATLGAQLRRKPQNQDTGASMVVSLGHPNLGPSTKCVIPSCVWVGFAEVEGCGPLLSVSHSLSCSASDQRECTSPGGVFAKWQAKRNFQKLWIECLVAVLKQPNSRRPSDLSKCFLVAPDAVPACIREQPTLP